VKGWQERFTAVGATLVDTLTGPMGDKGFITMLDDEGIKNTTQITLRWVFNRRIRNRMTAMNRFFRDNRRYFSYGIYVIQK
jgi:hypothetical protein